VLSLALIRREDEWILFVSQNLPGWARHAAGTSIVEHAGAHSVRAITADKPSILIGNHRRYSNSAMWAERVKVVSVDVSIRALPLLRWQTRFHNHSRICWKQMVAGHRRERVCRHVGSHADESAGAETVSAIADAVMRAEMIVAETDRTWLSRT
jgi:hypothetical protein